MTQESTGLDVHEKNDNRQRPNRSRYSFCSGIHHRICKSLHIVEVAITIKRVGSGINKRTVERSVYSLGLNTDQI